MLDRRVTFADVAREAKVHPTTVSMAMRNHPRLPLETRQRIQEIAKDMGYRPDPAVQALVAYRRRVKASRMPSTIAYVTNWDTRFGWKQVTAHPDFYAGAQSMADMLGYKMEHFWMGEPGMTHSRLNQILRTRGINGLIIASHRREVDVALHFAWEEFSAVKIDYFPHMPALHNVTNNQCGIIRLAMQHVRAAGYKRIGFVMHRGWDHSVDNLWTAGFLCDQSKLPAADHVPILYFPGEHPIDAWMNESRSNVQVDAGDFLEWYRRYKPDVILSNRTFVQAAFEQCGLSIPRDVAFVDLFLDQGGGFYAGVRQSHHTVGELAVELLAGQLMHNKCGIPQVAHTTFVEGTWFGGPSCPALTGVPAEEVAFATA